MQAHAIAPPALVSLDTVTPPSPYHEVEVDKTHPIEAWLDDGTPISVTAVLQLAAVIVRPGHCIFTPGPPKEVGRGGEVVSKARVLVEPEALGWSRVKQRRGSKMTGWNPMQKAQKCATCKRTVATAQFRDRESPYCLDHEPAV